MNNNILITGSDGQLGSEIKQIANEFQQYNFLIADISNLDITDHTEVARFIEKNKVDIIINCAAYTDVENSEFNICKAKNINHLAVHNLAKISKNNNLKLIHISNGFIYTCFNVFD